MPRVIILQPTEQFEELVVGTLLLPKGLTVRVEDQEQATDSGEGVRNNYRLQVLAIHKLLDDLGIPSAADVRCSDPGCDSGLEHRVRKLISLYKEQQTALDNAKEVAASQFVGIVKGKLLEALNGAGRKH